MSTDIEYGSQASEDFWSWFGAKLDARDQARAELATKRAERVAPPRPLATPGQTFAPEPDARAREAIEGFPRKPRTEVRVTELMRNTTGVCG